MSFLITSFASKIPLLKYIQRYIVWSKAKSTFSHVYKRGQSFFLILSSSQSTRILFAQLLILSDCVKSIKGGKGSMFQCDYIITRWKLLSDPGKMRQLKFKIFFTCKNMSWESILRFAKNFEMCFFLMDSDKEFHTLYI